VSVATTHAVLNNLLAAAHEPLPAYPSSRSTSDFFISNPNLGIHQVLEGLVDPSTIQFHLSGVERDLLYYELTTGGHAIWAGVYGAPPVYGWLFSHVLPVPEPSSDRLFLMGGVAMGTLFVLRSYKCRRLN